MIFSALSVGLLSSSTSAQQQTNRTYNPPVHISPGQTNAVQKYTGIVEPKRESEFSIVGSIPATNSGRSGNSPRTHRQQTVRKTPQLQNRIANAFGGFNKRSIGNRQARDNAQQLEQPRRTPTLATAQPQRFGPTTQPPQYGQPSQRSIAIGTGVKPPAYQPQPATAARPMPTMARFQSRNETLLEEPQSIVKFESDHERPQPSAGTNQLPNNLLPPQQVVQRRAAPRQYPVQPIQSDNRQADTSQVAQSFATDDGYYTRPDIRKTSAQQVEDDRFLEPQPEIHVAQVPHAFSPVQDNSMRAAPVSVLNSGSSDNGPFETPRIAPDYYQDEEVNDYSQGPDRRSNDLRDMDDQAEDITAEEEDDDVERKSFDKPCDEMRSELLNSSITEIALDISPIKSGNPSEFGAAYRNWTDQFGRTIASGSISSVRRGYVIIESGGGLQKIPFGNLSDPDLQVVAEYWQTPKECTVSQDTFVGRSWMPQTLTWKASNLCHKPLYFENVQLERYGHSHGPFSQPVHSTIHFFKSLALLPYNTGINPPNECRYALGYYRPGNCAPWLEEPFPISLAGAKHQARAMVGGAFLITP